MYKNVRDTSQTIVIAALSGVAATLVLRETTHSALHLNNKTITPEQIELWQTTHLVTIDEILFANQNDFEKNDKHVMNYGKQHAY